MTLRHTISRLATFGALAALATGCSGLLGSSDSSAEPDEAKSVGVETIDVGACVDEPDLVATIEDVTRVPCAEPHDLEAYHAFDLEGDELPPESEIEAAATDECLETAFTSFVGVAFDDSELEVTYLFPLAASWDSGDRRVLCLVYEPDTKVTGSLKSANR